jgi:hypothetical protein
MSNVIQAPAEAEAIQRQMRSVREDMRADVRELVVSAREMTDWTIYVKAYPWLCLGAALAVGFVIVPSRSVIVKPDAEGLIELAKRNKLVVKMHETPPPPKKRGGLMAELLGLATGTLLQTGIKLITSQISQGFRSDGQPHRNGHPGVTS